MRHGRKCAVQQKPCVWIGGFVCKSNSALRADRWDASADPLGEDSQSLHTFELSINAIRHCRPEYFVLENVEGF